MAGRSLPGDAGRAERCRVDRRIHRHCRDGMCDVAWSTPKQPGLVWPRALSLRVAAAAGNGEPLAWQRVGDRVAAPPFIEKGSRPAC
jgi:hypothetical protein